MGMCIYTRGGVVDPLRRKEGSKGGGGGGGWSVSWRRLALWCWPTSRLSSDLNCQIPQTEEKKKMVSLYSRRRRCNGEYIHVGYFSNHLPSIVQDFPFRFDGSVFLFHRRISGLLRTSSSRYKPEMKSYVARRRRKKILKAEGNLLAGHPGGGFQSYFPPFSLSHTDLPRAIFSCLYIHLQQGRSWSSAQEESRSLVHTCCCGGEKKGNTFHAKNGRAEEKKNAVLPPLHPSGCDLHCKNITCFSTAGPSVLQCFIYVLPDGSFCLLHRFGERCCPARRSTSENGPYVSNSSSMCIIFDSDPPPVMAAKCPPAAIGYCWCWNEKNLNEDKYREKIVFETGSDFARLPSVLHPEKRKRTNRRKTLTHPTLKLQ